MSRPHSRSVRTWLVTARRRGAVRRAPAVTRPRPRPSTCGWLTGVGRTTARPRRHGVTTKRQRAGRLGDWSGAQPPDDPRPADPMTGAAVYLLLGLSLLLAIVLPQVTQADRALAADGARRRRHAHRPAAAGRRRQPRPAGPPGPGHPRHRVHRARVADGRRPGDRAHPGPAVLAVVAHLVAGVAAARRDHAAHHPRRRRARLVGRRARARGRAAARRRAGPDRPGARLRRPGRRAA